MSRPDASRLARSVHWLGDHLPRPLDPVVRSIKIKIGIVIVGAITVSMVYFSSQVGWWPPATTIGSVAIALAVAQVLAHGMTSPLREMTAAARAMARGDYGRRVRATSQDEVGQLGRAFNQMAADLEAADLRRRELIANVSHELRTPITALRAVLENMVDGVAEPDPETLDAALAQTRRLGRLVAELLDLSRMDAGAMPLHQRDFCLADLLTEVVAEARATAANVDRDVTFGLRVEPPTATARGDRERLYQVVMNLVDNAARHSPTGREITIQAGYLIAGGERRVLIEVGDDGPGIAPEERDRVFERFTRGERAVGGGTGLGLAIARWIVELHGGSISVVDGHGPGCHIRVLLPLATASG